MTREMTVDGVRIADDTDTYVIAEIGNNHQGDVEKCKEMFKVAKQHCGVTAVKLQKRDNKTLYTRAMYNSEYNSENAFADTYGAHREKLEFGRDEYVELKNYAKELGITFFATAFDIPSADFLADLDMPAYKLASGDLTNTPLLKHVASFGKPMFVSTGGGTMEDVHRAYDTILPINKQLCILQCTAGYPPEWEQLDLGVITTFRHAFPDAVIGFSSHDSGIAMGPPSHVLGSRVIEKHFTLNRAQKGTDHAFSLEPTGLAQARARPPAHQALARQGREAALRERGRPDQEDVEEAGRGARSARRPYPHQGRHRHQVAGRRAQALHVRHDGGTPADQGSEGRRHAARRGFDRRQRGGDHEGFGLGLRFRSDASASYSLSRSKALATFRVREPLPVMTRGTR